MPVTKTQSEWVVIGQKIGTYVRTWYRHQTNITEAGGWNEIAQSISTNFNDDEKARQRAEELHKFIQEDITRAQGRKTAILARFNTFILNDLKEFLKSGRSNAVTHVLNEWGVNKQTGILKDLQVGMKNNVATQQFFLAHSNDYATPTSWACNTVIGTTGAIITNLSLTQLARTQRVSIITDNETAGQERFLVSGEISGNEPTRAQVGSNYAGYYTGLNFKVVRQQTEVNDSNEDIGYLDLGRNMKSGNVDLVSNANAMRLHVIIWPNHAGCNEVRVYKASNEIMHTNLGTNLVAIGQAGYGVTPINLTASNSSKLSGSIVVDAAAAFTAATNIYYDFLRFRLNDSFFVDTTRHTEGRIQKFFTDGLKIAMNSGTNDVVTIPDTFAGG